MDESNRNRDHDEADGRAVDDAADQQSPSGPGQRDDRRAPAVVRIGHETPGCRSYRPGHTVHFIQARHAAEYAAPTAVLASVDADGQILVTDETGGLRLHNHTPAQVAAALARSGGRAELVPAKSVLGVPSIRGGALFSIATDRRRSPCAPGPRPGGTPDRNGPEDSGRSAE